MASLRDDANHCFVCGPSNPIGLQLEFALYGEVCRSEYTPEPDHCGYDGVTHGGLIYSVLDDVMANWIFLKGIRAYTARCDIRYKDALPVGIPTKLEGRCMLERGRLFQMQGTMVRKDTDELVAECEASFMRAPE